MIPTSYDDFTPVPDDCSDILSPKHNTFTTIGAESVICVGSVILNTEVIEQLFASVAVTV